MPSKNNYQAISIDTNSLIDRGFALKGPILSKFQKFKESEVSFVQPDVIHRECLKHFALHISESTADAKKSLSKLNGHGILEAKLHDQIKGMIEQDSDFNMVASTRLSEFYELSGTEIIKASEYLDTDDLLDMYFEGKSPFEKTGKKKCEFPDACALLILESWAEEQDVNVVLISSDGGWEDFAKKSERMFVFKDVAKALEFLLPTEDKKRIYKFIEDKEVFSSPNFLTDVQERLQNSVEGLDIYVNVDAPMNWYSEYEYLTYHDFDFQSGISTGEMFSIINVDKNKVDISIPITVTCFAEADFSLFVRDTVDHEDISMGSIHESREVVFDAEVFVSMELHVSDGFSTLSKLEINDIETYDYDPNIDFGYIDPFQDEHEQYE